MKIATELYGEIEVEDFCGLPILGELPGCASVILANWEGNACKVLTKKQYPGKDRLLESIYKKNPNLFEPMDKGAFSVYGCDRYGNVIFGCCVYEGDPRSHGHIERQKHLYVLPCKSVNGFNHYNE